MNPYAHRRPTVALFANTDWYLFNFRLDTALALKRQGYRVILMSPDGGYARRFADIGLEWLRAPLQRGSLAPWQALRTLCWLVTALRRERVDLLHGFTLQCCVLGAVAGRLVSGLATVSAVAGLGSTFTATTPRARLLRPCLQALLSWSFRGKAHRVITQNADDMATLAGMPGVPRACLRLIRSSGVSLDMFRPRPTQAAMAPPRIVMAARLLRAKGVTEFVAAARIVHARGLACRFVLAGDRDPGNGDSVSAAELDAWHSDPALACLGHVDDMPGLLATADIVALPSYYGEGVPKSLIEAAACGLAIVTTDSPGCRDVVSNHGVDGLIVPPRDAVALANAIGRLVTDRALRVSVGVAARKRAIACFDVRTVVTQTIAVYEELLLDNACAR